MTKASAESGEFNMAKEILEERRRVQEREVQKKKKMPRIDALRI